MNVLIGFETNAQGEGSECYGGTRRLANYRTRRGEVA
jgi:hypothetical protein